MPSLTKTFQFAILKSARGEMSEWFKELVLKPSRIHLRVFPKILDFIEVFGCFSALCEKVFSQISRKFLAFFASFQINSEWVR